MGKSNDASHRARDPNQRPRWERVRAFVAEKWQKPCAALFFMDAGRLYPPFAQALTFMGYKVVSVFSPTETADDSAPQKLVDEAIKKVLRELLHYQADVALVSHDEDYIEDCLPLLEDTERRVGVIGFLENINGRYFKLQGIEIYDLERDANAFTWGPLPRSITPMSLGEFDAKSLLEAPFPEPQEKDLPEPIDDNEDD